MSLLHQESSEETDDVALGEDFTKGSSHIVLASVSAVLLLTLIIAAYVMAVKKPLVTGEIVQVWAHPRHIVTSGFDASGASVPPEHFDQVLVFAHVKLHNQSKIPLFLEDVLANTEMEGNAVSASAGTAGQYEQVFIVYPELAALHSNALSPRATIEPGQTVEGNILWAFKMTKEEWDARKKLDFTFKFHYQANLELAPHSAVIEQ
jgi:hypothetical protein